ncbi:hypothetical protein C0J52_22797 [Blattella germanica]|nr:hypothetical protein C0J52_22797 [Blattella germanica]
MVKETQICSPSARSGTSDLSTAARDAEDSRRPSTSRAGEEFLPGTVQSPEPTLSEETSETAKILSLESISIASLTSNSSATQTTSKLLEMRKKVKIMCKVVEKDIDKVKELCDLKGESDKLTKSQKLLADVECLVRYSSELNSKLEILIEATVKVPFSENAFVNKKNEVISHCKAIENLSETLIENIRHIEQELHKGKQDEADEEEYDPQVAYEMLGYVRQECIESSHYLEQLRYPEAPNNEPPSQEGLPPSPDDPSPEIRPPQNQPQNIPDVVPEEESESENGNGNCKFVVFCFCNVLICLIVLAFVIIFQHYDGTIKPRKMRPTSD